MSRASGGACGHDRGPQDGAPALRLEHELGALGDGIRDHAFHAVGGRAAHHRADIDRGILGVAHLELLRGGHEQLEEAVEHGLLDDHALRRDALLSARFEAGARDAGGGVVEVGVGAHDVGGVGAELADEFLRAGGAGKLVAGGGAAGDGDGGDQRMGGKQLGGLAPAGDDVEEPVGDARLLHRFRHQQRDLGAGRRRLDHDRVADRERRRHFLNEQIGRPVERRHRGDHAVRHARGEAETAGARRGHVERQHLAHEMRHLRGAGAQEHADALGLECRGAPRLADEAG